jgi:hypothetical protein
MLNKFIMKREVKVMNVDGEDIRYLRLGKKTVFLDLDIPINSDGTIGHYLTNVELVELGDYHYKIRKGNKNIFIVEYVFKSGEWCGLSDCITNSKAFNYWVMNKDLDFITDSAGIVVETDKNYMICKKYFKKRGVWNNTEIEYIYSDTEKMKVLEFDITKIK